MRRLLPLALLIPHAAFAHSGGLDAQGCHTNRSTGDYHCHGAPSSSSGGFSSQPSSPRNNSAGSNGPNSSGSYIRITPVKTRPYPTNPRPSKPSAVSGPAELISVGDGDTIRVRQNGKAITIRLACIDAPETGQGNSGAQSSYYLKQLMAMGSVEIYPKTVDRYGRTVAEVYAGGRNVNLQMVASGNAYAYRQYLSGCDQASYLGAESQAEQQRLGVWRWGATEQKPWDFRKNP